MKYLWLMLALMASPLTLADQTTDSGFYVGAGLGLVHYDHDDFFDSGALIGSSFDDDSTGFKLVGGYRVNNWFSVEAGYSHLGSYYEEGKGANDDDDLYTSLGALTAGFIVHAPLGDMVKLFAQVGAGLAYVSQTIDYDVSGVDIEEKESDSGPAGQLGVGFMVAIPQVKGLEIRAGYESYFFETDLYNVNTSDELVSDEVDQRVDQLYAGITYRF